MSDLQRAIGVAEVNARAASITVIEYPEWCYRDPWVVTGKLDEADHEGYDVFLVTREGQTIEIPANRLVVMSELLKRLR